MNVKELRKALEGLPDDLPVEAFTTGDVEFRVRLVTIYERAPLIKPRLLLGNDPEEFDPKNEKLLHADETEDGRVF